MELVFVTRNQDKLKEAASILGGEFKLKNVDIDLAEVQDIDSRVVAQAKADSAYKIVNAPLFVEDISLRLNAWNKLPGALIRWFLKQVGPEGIIKMLEGHVDKTCTAQAVIAYNNGGKIELFEGLVEGTITPEKRGKNGFDWDFIFVPDGYSKTFAEMNFEEKNEISPRRLAFEDFRKFLLSK